MNMLSVPLATLVRRGRPWLACLTVMGMGVAARADDILPGPAPANRYEKLAAHSPFAPPTAGPALPAPVATPPPGPTWSDNLTVTSLLQIGQVYTATVIEKDNANRHFIRSDREDPDSHLMVASVRWAAKPADIKVTVRKGTQFGDVHFDPNGAPASGPAPGAPVSPMNRPGLLIPPGQGFRPPLPVAAMPINPPPGVPPNNILRGRPVIRANPMPIPVAPTRPLSITPAGQAGRANLANQIGKDDDDDDDN